MMLICFRGFNPLLVHCIILIYLNYFLVLCREVPLAEPSMTMRTCPWQGLLRDEICDGKRRRQPPETKSIGCAYSDSEYSSSYESQYPMLVRPDGAGRSRQSLLLPSGIMLRLRGGKGRVPGKGMKRRHSKRKGGSLNSRAPYDISEDRESDTSTSQDSEEQIRNEKGNAPKRIAHTMVSSSSNDDDADDDQARRINKRAAPTGAGAQLLGLGVKGVRPREDRFDWEAYGQEHDTDGMMDVVHISDSDDDLGPGRSAAARMAGKRRSTGLVGALEHAGGIGDGDAEEQGGDGDGSGRRRKAGRESGKAKRKRSKAGEVGAGNDVDDPRFGMRPADFADGGAFSEVVGTRAAAENRFYLPGAAERAFVLPEGDPLARLGRAEAEYREQRASALAERAERRAALAEARRRAALRPGVMYVGHIPVGFYEEAQFQFFSQYGTVTRIRLARSRRTGGYKGYGFVEFEDAAVAARAARDMDGYVLENKALKCHVIPPAKVHPTMFRGCERRFVRIRWDMVDARRRARPRTPAQEKRWEAKRRGKERKFKARLERSGLLKQGFSLDPDETSTLLAEYVARRQASPPEQVQAAEAGTRRMVGAGQ